MVKELKHKPLVEAILEIKWELRKNALGAQTDPHYKLLLGRLFDRVLVDYPEHEELQTASMPDELVGHLVQHRFRAAKGEWPLVQVGPGVFTVNSTADYRWTDFRSRVLVATKKLYDAHPKPQDMEIQSVVLRYIDAVEFDYGIDNALEFLRDKLKLNVALPENLFDGTSVDERPSGFTWQCSFKCGKPDGVLTVRFATGQKSGAPAIIWETTVESTRKDLPSMPGGFEGWFDQAHEITDDWFFKMIEGELERRFSGE